MDSIQERIVKTKKAINRKKGQISSLIFLIGVVMILSVLLGMGVGLILGKLVKTLAVSLASGLLISIDPIIRISNIAQDIKVDERVLTTLNIKNSGNHGVTNNKTLDRDQSVNLGNTNTRKKDLTDEDLDKMTQIFAKKTYSFSHSNTDVHQEMNQDIERQHKTR